MGGSSLGTLCALLLFAPFELWHAHVQNLRTLSPHEINLRRATQPLGLLALLLSALWLFGADGAAGDALDDFVRHPSDNLKPAGLLGAALLYGLASLITGTRRCWGVRSDGMLPVRALFKLVLGVVGLTLLRHGLPRSDDIWMELLPLALGAASVWCVVVGSVRFVLLTVAGGNARRAVLRHITARNAPLRAARRPWWRLWW
jgi:hypothetical protein